MIFIFFFATTEKNACAIISAIILRNDEFDFKTNFWVSIDNYIIIQTHT